MQKKFFSNLAFLIGINLLIKPIWVLGIDRAIQNRLGYSAYGLYFVLFNLSLLFNFVQDAGITNYNNKTIAQQGHLLPQYLPSLLVLKGFLAFLYIGLTFFAALMLGFHQVSLVWLSLLCFNQILSSFQLYLRSNLSALHFFKTDALLSVLDKFLVILICGAFLLFPRQLGEITIPLFIAIQSLALLVSLSTTFWLNLRYSTLHFSLCRPSTLKAILKAVYPYALLIFFMALLTRADSLLLEKLSPDGVTQAGIYASAFRLLDASNMLGVLVAAILLPMFARLIAEKKSVGPLLEVSLRLMIVVIVTLVGISRLFSREIMNALYVHPVPESASIFSWTMSAFTGFALMYIFGSLLTAQGQIRTLIGLTLFALAVNIGMNVWLIPAFGARGAAWSCFTSQVLYGGLQVLVAVRIFNLHPRIRDIFRTAAYILLVAIFGLLFKEYLIDWRLAMLATFILSLSLPLALKLVSLKKMKVLLAET
ncbi:MAG: oligosaccharide flippase family protein [Chitinophagaceae bacterium]